MERNAWEIVDCVVLDERVLLGQFVVLVNVPVKVSNMIIQFAFEKKRTWPPMGSRSKRHQL